MHEPIYEVFARKTREEPLRHIGVLNAPGDELARVFAWRTYDEQNWFEMCVVRREALLAVNRSERRSLHEVSGEGPADALVHSRGAGSYGGSEVATEAAR
jgi:1,2-phenylacetyl-CoA epoxidase PaaB subunit